MGPKARNTRNRYKEAVWDFLDSNNGKITLAFTRKAQREYGRPPSAIARYVLEYKNKEENKQ
jgi:hypothetical protein